VDPDTVLLPHTLLRLLRELHATIDPSAPLLLGMAACRATAQPPLCHAAGGAAYVLSAPAVAALSGGGSGTPATVSAEFAVSTSSGPSVLDVRRPVFDQDSLFRRVDNVSYGGEDVTVALALREASGASVVHCGSFYQHSPAKYAKMRAKGERWARWPLSRSPVSFHKFKQPAELRAFFACALYDATRAPRPYPRSLFAGAGNVSAAPPLLYRCDDPWTGPVI